MTREAAVAGRAVGGPAIEARGLAKRYGDKDVLDGLDLRVEPGSVFGFLGANGSGKTTTIRILLGLARQDGGELRVLGDAPGSAEVRQRIGYCPDVPGFPSWMTAREVLDQAASLFRIPGPTARRRADELLELTGLADTRSRVGGYSRGMRQRLGLAQALVNSPDLLVLDEPTSAMDPMGRRVVLELLSALRGRTTVFFSTHLLPDVERVCDDVAILGSGRVVASGPLEEVRTRYGGARGRLLVRTDDAPGLLAALEGVDWVPGAEPDPEDPSTLLVTVDDVEDGAARVAHLVTSRGGRLYRLEPREASLEDVFVELVEGGR